MKRIGFVISTSKPGGVEIALLRTLRALDRERCEPVVCVTGEHGTLHEQYEHLAVLTDEPAGANIDILNIYNHLAWAAAFWERLAETAPDVVQHVYMHAATLFWHHARDKSYYAFVRNFLRHRYVVCDSPATADAIVQDVTLLANTHPADYAGRKRDNRGIPARIKVVQHPHSIPAPRVALFGRCLWVGAATWVKGFDLLPGLIARHRQAEFHVVLKTPPDESTSPELQTAYDTVEKQPHAQLHTALSPEHLATLRANCDVYLSTSRREGQSLAWDEAKDAGLLCLDAAGAPSVPAKLGILDVADLWEDAAE